MVQHPYQSRFDACFAAGYRRRSAVYVFMVALIYSSLTALLVWFGVAWTDDTRWFDLWWGTMALAFYFFEILRGRDADILMYLLWWPGILVHALVRTLYKAI